MSLKKLYFYLWWPFCLVEQNHFGNFGGGLMRKIRVKLVCIWASILEDVV